MNAAGQNSLGQVNARRVRLSRAHSNASPTETQVETARDDQVDLDEDSNVYNPDVLKYITTKIDEAEMLEREKLLGIRESRLLPHVLEESFRFKRRKLSDLKGFRPTQLRFLLSHPKDEEKDGWFEEHFRDLYARVNNFATVHFGLMKTPTNYRKSAWVHNFSSEFIDYASAISRQDPVVGGWEGMMRDETTRAYLCMGIIAKVLENHVFSELLFGADEEQKKALKGHDEDTLDSDGMTYHLQLNFKMPLQLTTTFRIYTNNCTVADDQGVSSRRHRSALLLVSSGQASDQDHRPPASDDELSGELLQDVILEIDTGGISRAPPYHCCGSLSRNLYALVHVGFLHHLPNAGRDLGS